MKGKLAVGLLATLALLSARANGADATLPADDAVRERGLGIAAALAKDYAAAMDHFLKAAGSGDGPAMYHVGQLYLLGRGTPVNRTEAFAWTKKAAESGVPEGMFNLAVALDQGLGTAPDAKAAMMWYVKAFDAGQRELSRHECIPLCVPSLTQGDHLCFCPSWKKRRKKSGAESAADQRI